MAVIGDSSSFVLAGGQHHGGQHSAAHQNSQNWCCCTQDPDDCCSGLLLGKDLFAEILEDNDCGCIIGQVCVLTYVPIDVNGNTRWQGRMFLCDSADAGARNWADIWIQANRQLGPCTIANHSIHVEFDGGSCTNWSEFAGVSCSPYSFVSSVQSDDACCNDTNATPDSTYYVRVTDVDPR